jgi:hypothetical protein
MSIASHAFSKYHHGRTQTGIAAPAINFRSAAFRAGTYASSIPN